jgi:predicted transcriptional regulator
VQFSHGEKMPNFETQYSKSRLDETLTKDFSEMTEKRKLYNLLENGMNDIKNANTLTEEEMDRSLDTM